MTTRERLHEEVERIPDEVLEEALRALMSVAPSDGRGKSFYETATPEQFGEAMDRIAAGHEGLPVLPPEAFERESLYEERF